MCYFSTIEYKSNDIKLNDKNFGGYSVVFHTLTDLPVIEYFHRQNFNLIIICIFSSSKNFSSIPFRYFLHGTILL